ncbi:hypothetical protein J2Y40_000606 [Chryseobacterium sp. 2987]|nr:hypothetical protein [Chryseobacterium sp. 2987]
MNTWKSKRLQRMTGSFLKKERNGRKNPAKILHQKRERW